MLAGCDPTIYNINRLSILHTVIAVELAMWRSYRTTSRVRVWIAVNIETVQPRGVPEDIDGVRTGPFVDSNAHEQVYAQ